MHRTGKRTALLLVLVAAATGVSGQQAAPASVQDPLAPKMSTASAVTGPLGVVTICTGDAAPYLRLFRDGLGMRARGPVTPSAALRAAHGTLWGLRESDRWTEYLFDRPAVSDGVRIRLLVLDHPGPLIRASRDPKEPAPLAMGFPTTDLPALDTVLRTAGFGSIAPIEHSRIPRPDGTTYGYQEAIYPGPDGIHAVGISRLDGMPQLGPVDPATGRGGPAYSTQVIRDSDAIIRFYCDLLGFELRSDREWKTGATSALGLTTGTSFRFSILYSPGSSSGSLLLMDFRDEGGPASGVAPRPPNRGIAMWTFPVRNLEQVAATLRAANVTVVGGPLERDDPFLGTGRAMTVLAPNGFLVELVQESSGK